jgi:hypothetical protein
VEHAKDNDRGRMTSMHLPYNQGEQDKRIVELEKPQIIYQRAPAK